MTEHATSSTSRHEIPEAYLSDDDPFHILRCAVCDGVAMIDGAGFRHFDSKRNPEPETLSNDNLVTTLTSGFASAPPKNRPKTALDQEFSETLKSRMASEQGNSLSERQET